MTRIVLTGGGTLGPVTPLLAIAEAVVDREDMEVVGFVGTRKGPERTLVEQAGIPFFAVSAGKWRRYLDVQNILGPFRTLLGIVQSFVLLAKLKPSVVVSGGSFVGVPVLIAARLLGMRTITHQQDMVPSLANKLVARFVHRITVTFEATAGAFPKQKTVVTGNPVRPSLLRGDASRLVDQFALDQKLPTLFVFGGGSGAETFNHLLEQTIPELTKFCQVIHATGRGKFPVQLPGTAPRYHPIEFVAKVMPDVYAVADLVVGRAGIGTITELAALGKPAIIVPIPGTHQEKNAQLLHEHDAAVVVPQEKLTAEFFVRTVQSLFADKSHCNGFGVRIHSLNPSDALARVLRVIESF